MGDHFSQRWKNDPVRALIEKKEAKEQAVAMKAEATKQLSELLKKKLDKKSVADQIESPREPTQDEAYKRQLDKQRKRLMEGGDSDSDSSASSVFDPFASKRVKKARK